MNTDQKMKILICVHLRHSVLSVYIKPHQRREHLRCHRVRAEVLLEPQRAHQQRAFADRDALHQPRRPAQPADEQAGQHVQREVTRAGAGDDRVGQDRGEREVEAPVAGNGLRETVAAVPGKVAGPVPLPRGARPRGQTQTGLWLELQ